MTRNTKTGDSQALPAVTIPHAIYRIVDCLTLLPAGYAPPCQSNPPKNYREIFQVLRDIIPQTEQTP